MFTAYIRTLKFIVNSVYPVQGLHS